jgi:hypothetical protein
MDEKTSTGVGAAVGSLVGLLLGSIAGSLVFKPRPATGWSGVAKALGPGLAGTAIGAAVGATWGMPANGSGTGTAGLPAGVGRAGLGAASQGEPSRYDPKRYAGKDPPHKCSAASSAQIAKQIDPRWTPLETIQPVYGKSCGQGLPAGYTESTANVTTPMGAKTIPVWTYRDGTKMALQCPYTGQYFFFSRPS